MVRVLGGLLAMWWLSLAHGQNAALDRELAAVAHDPALPLASLSVLALRDGQVDYSYQTGLRQLISPLPAWARIRCTVSLPSRKWSRPWGS
jgi:hypothetical protein